MRQVGGESGTPMVFSECCGQHRKVKTAAVTSRVAIGLLVMLVGWKCLEAVEGLAKDEMVGARVRARGARRVERARRAMGDMFGYLYK